MIYHTEGDANTTYTARLGMDVPRHFWDDPGEFFACTVNAINSLNSDRVGALALSEPVHKRLGVLVHAANGFRNISHSHYGRYTPDKTDTVFFSRDGREGIGTGLANTILDKPNIDVLRACRKMTVCIYTFGTIQQHFRG
jgi:hypothetical protein